MKEKKLTNTLQKNWPYIAVAALALLLAASLAWGINQSSNQADKLRQTGSDSHDVSIETALEEHGITPLTVDQASNNKTTAAELTYLIEEEKLAHDVYQVLYEKWGSRVFSNIQQSETMHQNMVLAVMESRDLTDPRTNNIGVFVNKDLQTLYDKLIAQGMQSETEAFKAGVIVEETDIADLKSTIAKLDPKDTDVRDVLDNLLHGSENHLRAFNRQLSL